MEKYKKKIKKKKYFFASCQKLRKQGRFRIRGQRYGSPGPDSYQTVTNPDNWLGQFKKSQGS
jgi:hypothetical protein